MKPHYQTYKPERGIKHEPLWAILTICAIAGTKTLTSQDLRRIKSLGFEIIQKTEPELTF